MTLQRKRALAIVPSTETNPVKRPQEIGATDMRRVSELVEMLTYRRPHESETEWEFIEKYVMTTGAKADKFGNFVLRIGDAPVLWSGHTDTVHRKEGRQQLSLTASGVVMLDKAASPESNCLGADDATGIWIMREMIQAQVPGLYIFHRGEELGGAGSSWLAANHNGLLDGIKVAVAFDRKGYGDVIVSQGGACASDSFAIRFGELLGDWWEPAHGIYTDTAEYTHLIPECTNLSVGYFNQHSDDEWQDLRFASWLRDKMVTLSSHEIASMAVRTPVKKMRGGFGGYYNSGAFGGGHYADWGYKSSGSYTGREIDDDFEEGEGFMDDGSYYGRNRYEEIKGQDLTEELKRIIEGHPFCTADFLEHNGFTLDDLKYHIRQLLGPDTSFDK